MKNQQDTAGQGPLVGYRVLELGSTVAGPFCGRLLADFGAEVIKVEPAAGDAVRTMGKQSADQSLYAASILRNKSLISIDLKTEEGRRLVRKIAANCDVVIENFRPGTMEKWGLGYEQLAVENPKLVMVRISGFGQTGPYRERAGYGVIGEAMSGLRHVTGDPDRPPTRAAVSLTDCLTGLYGAFGTLMAILHSKTSGKGQVIDAALYECAFSFMEPHVPAFDKLGVIAQRAGSRLPDSTPNNLYMTSEGLYIHITAMGDSVFRRLTDIMERTDLANNNQYKDAVARSKNHEALDTLINEWTSSQKLEELEKKLQNAGVPATRIFTMEDIFSDVHFKSRDMLSSVPHDTLGEVTVAGVVPKLSLTPGSLYRCGGEIGRDTRKVLREIVGLADEAIDKLNQQGVVKSTS